MTIEEKFGISKETLMDIIVDFGEHLQEMGTVLIDNENIHYYDLNNYMLDVYLSIFTKKGDE